MLSGGKLGFFQESYVDFDYLSRRVTRPHGSSGVVKSKFRHNLPPRAFGASVRVVRFYSFPNERCVDDLAVDAVSLEHLIFRYFL